MKLLVVARGETDSNEPLLQIARGLFNRRIEVFVIESQDQVIFVPRNCAPASEGQAPLDVQNGAALTKILFDQFGALFCERFSLGAPLFAKIGERIQD